MNREERRQVREKKARAMARLSRQGMTLQAIGDIYGITGERVRQLIGDLVPREKRGIAITAKENRKKREQEKLNNTTRWRTESCKTIFGCTLEEYKKINGGLSPRSDFVMRYVEKRKNVLSHADAEWNLSLVDYYKLWKESGKRRSIGKEKHKYCLTRKDLTKGFTKDNCIITTKTKSSQAGIKYAMGR